MLRRRGYDRREGKKGRNLILLVIALIICFFVYKKYINHQFEKANQFLIENQLDKAADAFQKVVRLPMSKSQGRDGLGVVALLQNDQAKAKQEFKIVLENKPSKVGAHPSVVFSKFLNKGDYLNADIYRAFLSNWKDNDLDLLKNFNLDMAAVNLGLRRVSAAKTLLSQTSEAQKLDPRYAKLNELVTQCESDKSCPVIFDRNGQVLLTYNLESKSYQFRSEKLFAGWITPDKELLSDINPIDQYNHIHTTLDVNLQKAAHQSMKNYNGTMILMDPLKGDVLAAYGTDSLSPFTKTFEPGSVIKVLTYGAWLKEDGDLSKYVPKKYAGNMMIGGKIFYDWTTQGQLKTAEEGMAVSCNLMFAQMGNDLGWSRFQRHTNGFFSGTPENFLFPASYGGLSAEPEGAWELGRAAIGLDFWKTTVLGLVQIPSMVANKGTNTPPFLIKKISNIEGASYQVHTPSTGEKLYDEAQTEPMFQSMVESVTFSRGTARRAQVPFVNAAMKTGTAGDRPFDSIMIGLLPKESPKIAFALFLDKGGKCEINGARVARSLQEQIKALAPEYLE